MNVFDLMASISLDTSKYDEGLKKSSKEGSSFASKLGGSLKTAAKVGTAAIGAVTGASVALGKSFYNNINQVADYGDNVDKMSQKIGISAESYQKWDYVMQRAGGSVDSLKMGMKTLSVQAEKNSDAFQKLGISQDKVKKLSQEQLFEETVKGLSKLEAGTERTKLSTELLGKAGADLGPLLNSGSGAIEEQMKIAEDYGMIMSNKAVKASADFKDSLTTLSMTATGLKNKMMGEFLPSITLVTDGLAKLFTGDMSGADSVSKGISEIVSKAMDMLPQVLEIGEKVLGSLFNSLLDSAPKVFSAVTKLIAKVINFLPKALKSLVVQLPSIIGTLFKELDLGSILTSIMEMLVSLGESIAGVLPDLIPQLVSSFIDLIISFFSNIDNLYEVAVSIVNGLISGLLQAIPVFVEKLPSVIGQWISAALGLLPILIDGFIQLLEGVVAALPTIIKSLIEAIPQIITSVISALVEALPQLIQGVIQLVLALVENLPTIIIALIEAIPEIIESIVNGFIDNLPQLIEGAITLVVELVKHLPEIILGLIKAIPKIVMSIVNAFLKLGSKFLEIGKNLVKGIWDGIVSMGQWLWDKITGFFGGIVDGIKDFFGIHSPSKLFRDQIGKNLALGVGEGFIDTMSKVAGQMQDSIPTDFDTAVDYTTVATGIGETASGMTQNFSFEINNPQIRNDEDIDKLAERVSETLGRTFRQRSVAFG